MSTSTIPHTSLPALPRRDRVPAHPRPLARYIQPDGLLREIVVLPGAQASTLLVDRIAGSLGDSRLLAHLPADEPAENARLVCRMYLADPSRGGCRRLSRQDFKTPSLSDPAIDSAGIERELRDPAGGLYRIRLSPGGRGRLRWTRCRPGQTPARCEEVSLREVVAALEAYEPACSITRQAIATSDPDISTYALRKELRALSQSPFVLNRALREAVLHAIEHHGASMSEIAIRCGRVKRTPSGDCGETTWLGRRIGLKPDSVSGRVTPWVHADVLALIAREGLGIAPADVEME
jgi:hypothetical protein